jgi:hypothetical protein
VRGGVVAVPAPCVAECAGILPQALRFHPLRLQRLSMPAVVPHRWTAAEVRALPDEPGKRFECVDGELLVSPSPRLTHQSVVALLWRVIVDLDARRVERWLPEADCPSVHTNTIVWQPATAAPALTVNFTPIFLDALGEP